MHAMIDHLSQEDIAFLVKASGVSERELRQPERAMFTGGVEKMVSVLGAMRTLQKRADDIEHDAMLQRGVDSVDAAGIAARTAAGRAEREAIPLWQRLTGLTCDKKNLMEPRDRRRALTRLFNATKFLFRHELARHRDAGADGERAGATALDSGGGGWGLSPDTRVSEVDLDAAAPRTILWDPIREVCHYLQIGKSALSRFLKELTGMSAIELVDSLKAMNIKGKMRTVLFPALRALLEEERGGGLFRNAGVPPSAAGGARSGAARAERTFPSARKQERNGASIKERRRAGQSSVDRRMQLWKRLKDSRRNPEFQRATHAIALGFASHQRMYRACLLAHGQTPSQIEWELIDEFLREFEQTDEARGALAGRTKRHAAAAPTGGTPPIAHGGNANRGHERVGLKDVNADVNADVNMNASAG